MTSLNIVAFAVLDTKTTSSYLLCNAPHHCRGIRLLPGWKHFLTIEHIMERRYFIKFTTSAALSGALAACGGSDSPSLPTGPTPLPTPTPPGGHARQIAIGWNKVALAAIRATRAAPPIGARAMAVVHTAMYDAWAAYDPVALGTRHGAALRRPRVEQTEANAALAFSFAAYAALLDQFPSQKAFFDAHMSTLGLALADSAGNPASPAGIGTLAARSVIVYAHADGSNQLGLLTASGIAYADYSGYQAMNPPLVLVEPTARSAIPYPSLWQPVTVRDAGGVLRTPAYLAPFWGQLRPFALRSGSQFRPPPPAAFGSADFTEQVRIVIASQAALTETHKVIADYWAGGASAELPSSYWSEFAQFVSRRDNHSEAQDIKLLFALSNALFDAGIAAWDAKRAYNSARPITMIRHLYNGRTVRSYGTQGPPGGLRVVAGEAWMPFYPVTTPAPAHPDYVSGHSTYSMAAAEVLRLFTGSPAFGHRVTVKAGTLNFEPGLPTGDVTLAWDTFSAAAAEAGSSRIYAGIHTPQADLAGRRLGEQVAAIVFARAQACWDGHA